MYTRIAAATATMRRMTHHSPPRGAPPEGGARIENVPVDVAQFPEVSRADTRYVYVPGTDSGRPAEYRPVAASYVAVRFATLRPLPSKISM
jgi:hypothetical protein